jgi:hypothetical protein
LKGKGYGIDPNELYLTNDSVYREWSQAYDAVSVTGDYHSGPLSVIIPLGMWGAIAFAWFLIAGSRYLYQNYRHGDPRLKQLNTFFLAFFVAKIAFFCTVFGSFQTDLYTFTGLLGLSVSLNGQREAAVESEASEAGQPALEAFS